MKHSTLKMGYTAHFQAYVSMFQDPTSILSMNKSYKHSQHSYMIYKCVIWFMCYLNQCWFIWFIRDWWTWSVSTFSTSRFNAVGGIAGPTPASLGSGKAGRPAVPRTFMWWRYDLQISQLCKVRYRAYLIICLIVLISNNI